MSFRDDIPAESQFSDDLFPFYMHHPSLFEAEENSGPIEHDSLEMKELDSLFEENKHLLHRALALNEPPPHHLHQQHDDRFSSRLIPSEELRSFLPGNFSSSSSLSSSYAPSKVSSDSSFSPTLSLLERPRPYPELLPLHNYRSSNSIPRFTALSNDHHLPSSPNKPEGSLSKHGGRQNLSQKDLHDIRERNRLASKKRRDRVKNMNSELQNRIENVSETNNQLKSEIKYLRTLSGFLKSEIVTRMREPYPQASLGSMLGGRSSSSNLSDIPTSELSK